MKLMKLSINILLVKVLIPLPSTITTSLNLIARKLILEKSNRMYCIDLSMKSFAMVSLITDLLKKAILSIWISVSTTKECMPILMKLSVLVKSMMTLNSW